MHHAGSEKARHISKAASPENAVSVHTLGWRQRPETPRQDSAQVKRTRALKLKTGKSDRASCRQVKVLRVWVPKSAWHSGWCWDGRVQTNRMCMDIHSGQWLGHHETVEQQGLKSILKNESSTSKTRAGIINVYLESMWRGLQKRNFWGRCDTMGNECILRQVADNLWFKCNLCNST